MADKPDAKDTVPESPGGAPARRDIWSEPDSPPSQARDEPRRGVTPVIPEPPQGQRTVALFVGPKGNRYQLLEQLGHGGMAEVYRACRVGAAGFQREVAIKKVRTKLAKSDRLRRMFIDEARLAANLSHRGVIQVHDYFEQDDIYYLVMELIRGHSLRDLLDLAERKRAALPEAFACYVCAELAEALHYAHGVRDERGRPLGIVHRDVSPHNVMLSESGDVKMLDFGIAYSKLEGRLKTESGLTKGKFAYMSPEQVRREQLDGRSDLFGLGVLFLELVTGKRIFECDDESETLRRIEACDPRFVEAATERLPEALRSIARRALAGDLQQRFASGAEMARELRKHLLTTGELFGAAEAVEAVRSLESLLDVQPTVPLVRPPQIQPEEIAQAQRRRDQSRADRAERGSSRRRLIIAGAALALLVGAGAALVARVDSMPAPPPGEAPLEAAAAAPPARHESPETTQAREHLKRANSHFSLGEFELAEKEYKETFLLRPVPALLFNLGQALRFQGKYEAAAIIFDRYAASKGEEKSRANAVALAAMMREKLRAEREPAPTPAPPAAAPVAIAEPVKPRPVARRSLDTPTATSFTEGAQALHQRVAAGTVLHAELIDNAEGASASASVRAEVTAMVAVEGSIVVPQGALVTCAALGTYEGRVGFTCDSIQLGDRLARFRGLVLSTDEKPGLLPPIEKRASVLIRVQEGF